jgi:hypothetical protein
MKHITKEIEICKGVSYIRTIAVVRHSRKHTVIGLKNGQYRNLRLSLGPGVTSPSAHTLSRSTLSRALTFALTLTFLYKTTSSFHHYY